MSAPTERVGGRLLLVDAAEQVLLIHETIDGGTDHWLTPGGGLEAGETAAQAAVREGIEEVGIRVDLASDTEAVLRTERLWSWSGTTYHQIDHFFLVRVPSGLAVAGQALTAMETQTLLGHRWWSVADLARTADVIEPPDLADVLTRLLHPVPGR